MPKLMGLSLRMNSIHAPTVPSGPVGAAARNGNPSDLTFAELQKRKAEMEAELKALGAVLDSVLGHLQTLLGVGHTNQRGPL